MKQARVDRSWFEDASESATVQLRTEKSLERVVEQRGAEARARIAEEKKQAVARRSRPILLGKMYSISYWAEELGYEPDTIRSWCKSGELNAQWLRNQWRITEKAMKEFLAKENGRKG